MNYLQRLIQEVRIVLFITLFINNILLFGVWYATREVWELSFPVVVTTMFFVGLIFNFLLTGLIGSVVTQPIRLLWRYIFRVSPSERGDTTTPRFTTAWLGKDLVTALTDQVRMIATATNETEQANAHVIPDLHQNFIANSLPLPIIVLNKNEEVLFANQTALRYFGKTESDFVGHSLRHKLNLVFSQVDQDFDTWLDQAKQSAATATQTWEEVTVQRAEGQDDLQFDLAAFYNKDNPDGYETMLVCFDHTATYTQHDQEIGFVALAVHELRTPITMLRGYIEALDEDLSGDLSGESADFVNKMKVASQQLTIFINNILNVARMEGNQLEVQLQEEQWPEILSSATENLRLRAKVHGIELECVIADGIPSVGVDRFSITEVVTNLVDNAIKYSAGKGNRIIVQTSFTKEGMVETTVQDNGAGIPENVLPTLFKKFQRNFHNRTTVKGTGLGLYLSKYIVTLHGGNVWVTSKEGEGTTVGFTVQTYASIKEGQKGGPDTQIIQSSHGWIKNHSKSRH